MPQEEKRKLYKKKKFVLIDTIPTWQQQCPDIVRKFVARHNLQPEKEVDENLNNKICMWRGDITTLEIDAIVNAANSTLMGGGGVDGAIHATAGSSLREECSTLGGCETGDAKMTAGYKLPARYIIHTVGPIGENPKKLSACYNKCLEIAKVNKLKTLAFPCISTGIYGYDIEKATPVVMTTVRNWLTENHEAIERIIFCVFLAKDVEVYEENLLKYFPVVVKEKPEPTNKKAKKELKAEKREGKKESKAEKHEAKKAAKSAKDNKLDLETENTDLAEKTVETDENGPNGMLTELEAKQAAKSVKDNKPDLKAENTDLDEKTVETEENENSPNRKLTEQDKETEENEKSPNRELTGPEKKKDATNKEKTGKDKYKDKKDSSKTTTKDLKEDTKEDKHVTRSKVKPKELKQSRLDAFLAKKNPEKNDIKTENADVKKRKEGSEDETDEKCIAKTKL